MVKMEIAAVENTSQIILPNKGSLDDAMNL